MSNIVARRTWPGVILGTLVVGLVLAAGAACDAPPPRAWVAAVEPLAGGNPETDRELRVFAAGRDRALTVARGNVGSPRWAPGAGRLAWIEFPQPAGAQTAFGFTLVIADRDGGRAVRHQIAAAPGAMAWSPDGRRLALVTGLEGDGTVRLRIFSADGTLEAAVSFGESDVFGGGFTAWSPGRHELLFEARGDLYVRTAGRDLRRLPAAPEPGEARSARVFRPVGWADESTVAGAWYFPGHPEGRGPEAMTLDLRLPGAGWERAPARDATADPATAFEEALAGPGGTLCRDGRCTFAGWATAGVTAARAEGGGVTILLPAVRGGPSFSHGQRAGDAFAGVTFDVALER